MIIRLERLTMGNHYRLKSCVQSLLITNRKLTSVLSSHPFLSGKEIPCRRYSLSSLSSSSAGDDRLVGDKDGVDKKKKKKPAFEEYDIFAQSDSSSKKTSVQGYGENCFEVVQLLFNSMYCLYLFLCIYVCMYLIMYYKTLILKYFQF